MFVQKYSQCFFHLQHEGSDNEGEENQAELDQEHDMTCHWKECQMQCESQDDLVKHVNSDHIKKDRKDFTCYWDGCSREKKPFKAQYMLVVHMRRHTGEKPHKCTVSQNIQRNVLQLSYFQLVQK